MGPMDRSWPRLYRYGFLVAETSEMRSTLRSRCQRRFGNARKFVELAAALCSAPESDEDPEDNQQAQALRRDFWTLWRQLHASLARPDFRAPDFQEESDPDSSQADVLFPADCQPRARISCRPLF